MLSKVLKNLIGEEYDNTTLKINQVDKKELDEFEDQWSPFNCKFNLVKSPYEIKNKTEHSKIKIQSLYFHNSENVWKFMKDEKMYN